MLPAYFLAHGAPSIVLEQNAYTDFLKQLPTTFPRQPRAIVVFTAHWENPLQQIGIGSRDGNESFETIYDFSGFPPEMYEMQYPAKSDAAIANEIANLFTAHQISYRLDDERGLDHGVWTLLKLIYPQADIPVVSLSVNPQLANDEQYRIGSALASLRQKDVLFIGSGGTVHNLRRIEWGATAPVEWASAFDQWLEERLLTWDLESLLQYEEQAPYAREAVPRNEHFIPLLLAMGTADGQRQAKRLHHSFQYGSLSLSAWQFG